MRPDETLLALFKANMLLPMNISRLVQRSSQDWLEAVRQACCVDLAETSEQIDDLLQAADWPALMALPAERLQRHLEPQRGGQEALTRIAIRQQIRFTNGLQQALISWQQSVIAAFSGRPEAASFVEIMRRWGRSWTENGTRAPQPAELALMQDGAQAADCERAVP